MGRQKLQLPPGESPVEGVRTARGGTLGEASAEPIPSTHSWRTAARCLKQVGAGDVTVSAMLE